MIEINKEFFTTLFLTVFNILILYFVLKKLLFKPVSKYMENRTNKIKEALDMAEEAKKKVESMEQDHQARMKEIKEEGIALMNTYKAKAQKEYDAVIEKAKKDSEVIIANTRSELQVEKEQLVAGLKAEISDLVLEASEKILNKNLDEKTNKELVENFIKEK